jgi:hypothetical protein
MQEQIALTRDRKRQHEIGQQVLPAVDGQGSRNVYRPTIG